MSYTGHEEAKELLNRIRTMMDGEAREAIAEELRRARAQGARHLYIFHPLITTPWGETQITITLRRDDFFAAQRDAIKEVESWAKLEQYAWMQPALDRLKASQSSAVFCHGEYDRDRVYVDWFDERQPR